MVTIFLVSNIDFKQERVFSFFHICVFIWLSRVLVAAHKGLIVQRHVVSHLPDQGPNPHCRFGRRTPNHWTTREIPRVCFWSDLWVQVLPGLPLTTGSARGDGASGFLGFSRTVRRCSKWGIEQTQWDRKQAPLQEAKTQIRCLQNPKSWRYGLKVDIKLRIWDEVG